MLPCNDLVLETPKMKYATRLNYWQRGYWVDALLRPRDVHLMESNYLLTVYRLIKRQAEKHYKNVVSFYLHGPEPQGEMARDVYMDEFDYVTSDDFSVEDVLYQHPFVPHLLREAFKRGTHPNWLKQFEIKLLDDEIEEFIGDLDQRIKTLRYHETKDSGDLAF